MTTEVALNRATRDTITSLRRSIDQAAVAGERLSTGKKVNSALDDPSSYFTSLSLSAHASEIDRTIEQLSQGIQVVKAADQGISSINDLIDAAKAVVNRSAESLDAFTRADFAKTYNGVLSQIEDVAEDSGYRGKNLLLGAGHDLKLYFGDQRTDAITIEAVDFTAIEATLGLPRIAEGDIAVLEANLSNGGTALGPDDLVAGDTTNFSIGDTIEVRNADGDLVASATIGASTRVKDLLSALNIEDEGLRASFADGTLKIEAATDLTITGGTAGGAFENATLDAEESGWFDADATAATLEQIKDATETLRLQSVTFGTNLTMLQNREIFMTEFSGTLTLGSENAVAADLNEEGANLLALNLRQQFASSAMTFSTEADQGVLRLLGA